MNSACRRPGLGWTWLLFSIALLALPLAALAEAPVRLGVLAHQGHQKALEQWQGHADYLNQRLAPLRFVIVPLGFADHQMNRAVQRREVDFLITNPGHYIDLQFAGLVTAIATRRVQGPTGVIDSFGGILITRADSNIQTYADLRGRTLLSTAGQSLGAWLAPLREGLEQGLDLRRDVRSIEVDTHQEVIAGLLRGEGDAGLIRNDLLDLAEKNDALQSGKLRLANLIDQADYPYPSSTRLYPEWPLAMVTGTPKELAKQVLKALLELPADHPAASSAGIRGWSIVGDYGAVMDLFRIIGQGPFANGQLSLKNLLQKYWLELSALGSLILAGLFFALVFAMRSRQQLLENQRLLKKSQEISSVGSWCLDHRSNQLTISDQVFRIFGYEPGAFEVSYQGYLQAIHPEDRDRVEQAFLNAAKQKKPWEMVHRILRPDGSVRVVLEKAENLENERGEAIISTGSIHDITQQSENERKLKLAANVFEHSAEGILITDADARILDVNQAFSRITGYPRDEVEGLTPNLLRSSRHDAGFYQGMWNTLLDKGVWIGVIWNRRKSGEEYAQQTTISTVRSGEQGARQYVAIFSDITEQLARQNHIEHLAHHDGLTGLPNRI
ncbi:MAG: PhnD/SsuA/transferrin family substrate-binding protein, partial [Gammaproteobacteria bacterium]|nr:PhnD/SsuA/transferrin family substrate-binding protein [Gammaproteobacteria bacterium]